MIRQFDIKIPLNKEVELPNSIELASKELSLQVDRIKDCKLLKRSIDARSKVIQVNLRYEAFIDEAAPKNKPSFNMNDVKNAHPIHIIGAGPAGLFAALQAIHLGLKPLLFERGKNVRDRRRDLAKINKEHLVNPESNYCFGEGGAGTYSDGKLYTRSKKRGDVQRVLDGLVQFGANENIAIEAHPHIGTNKLPQLIVTIRETILKAGGEIHFENKLTDLEIEESKIKSITLNKDSKIPVKQLIIATGHSARDVFEMLHKKGINIESKPFALGVRVEHPQALIDTIQYNGQLSDELLPPAAYQLVRQVDGKGVYSFCMCPGGIIAPCATNKGEIVTNGWSPSRRNNPYANSGIVVTVSPENWKEYEQFGPLAAMKFQESIEKTAFKSANDPNKEDGQLAPAQRLVDFVKGRLSRDLPKCSYLPGLVSARVDLILPAFISERLKEAFTHFGKVMRGYLTNEAIVVGVESRTSSPVSIPRDKESMQHIKIENLYPVGEGAGYAGGIVSAAIDGIKAIDAIAKTIGVESQTKSSQ
tara:strand:+ start:4348 stop:5943 length:1596 start_codon:yes stop_codon:yes gene_type:complete